MNLRRQRRGEAATSYLLQMNCRANVREKLRFRESLEKMVGPSRKDLESVLYQNRNKLGLEEKGVGYLTLNGSKRMRREEILKE